jgi:coiled-coil-helix-coiled-coil-helix domain-containing protein 2
MMSNIASTAVGVGIGHAIGHGITSLFSGGSAAAPVEQQQPQTPIQQQQIGAGGCETDAKAFTKCMDDFKGDMNVCSWYLDQLKVYG